MSDQSANLIMVGAIMGAFGVRGEVKVKTFTAAPEDIAAYGPLLNKDGAVVLTPRRPRVLKDAVALGGPEIKDRNAAEAARGTQLFVPRAKLPPATDDEFYHFDLIGLRAEDAAGADLGCVSGVENYGAGDLLQITPPAGAGYGIWLLPFTKENAPSLDFDAKRIVIDPPPGLGPNATSDDEAGDDEADEEEAGDEERSV